MDAAQVSFPLVSARWQSRRWGWDRWALVLLLLVAWVLRVPPTLSNRFHADEALYGYWGLLIGRGRDPWLVGGPAYKPPLLPYLVALSQILLGNSRFAVRFWGLVAGLVTISLVAALAYFLYRDRWLAATAAVGMTFSPFAILFSATAFTDPLMVALGVAGCVAMARERPGWAGLMVGLSFATKQTGVVWLVLATYVGIAIFGPQVRTFAGSFLLCFLLVVGGVFAWDAVRVGQGARSFWRTGVAGYGGLRLIRSSELWARLREWGGLAQYFFVSPSVNATLLAGGGALAWKAVSGSSRDARGLNLGRYTSGSLIDLSLIFFSSFYFLVHWFVAFPIWDRYLLSLTPVISILLARVLTVSVSYAYLIVARYRSWWFWLWVVVDLLLIVSLVRPGLYAAHSLYPVGGDHGAYDGIDQVVAFFQDIPEGTVVYQHWLGWHYAYHLFDGPVYLAYWPTPAWLARDVQAFGAQDPRYIVFPSWESSARVERALTDVGYGIESVLTTARRDGTRSFTVYRILPLVAR